MFMQELAFSFADVMIVVVSELTWPDQEYLKILQQKLQNSSKEYKQLFVVHNFFDISDEKDLIGMWRKYIVSNQTGNINEQKLHDGSNGIYFREILPQKSFPTFHFFLGKEGTPAGNKWNNKTYEMLRTFIYGRIVKDKKPMLDILIENVNYALNLYCKQPQPAKVEVNKNYETEKEQIPEPYENAELVMEKNESGIEEVKYSEWIKAPKIIDPKLACHFKLIADGDVSLKADKVNFDGFRILLIRKENQFDPPKHDVLRLDNGMCVLVDLPGFGVEGGDPGKFESKIKLNPLRELVIKGERELFYVDYEDTSFSKPSITKYFPETVKLPRLPSNQVNVERPSGPFQITIPLPGDIEDDMKKIKSVLKNGVLMIWLPKKVVDVEQKIETKY